MIRNFHKLCVLSLESRRADGMATLIERCQGKPLLAPSVKEVPIKNSPEVDVYTKKLFAGQIDLLVFFTGVGTRLLTEVVCEKHNKKEYAEALKKITVAIRGPKPLAPLRTLGIKPDIEVPEPNTWQDVLESLDAEFDVKGKTVAVQEYGAPNQLFLNELKKRGAIVLQVPLYKWALPDDIEPLKKAINDICEGKIDGVLFTSAVQVRHLFKVATTEGKAEALKQAFKKTLIGSIGPLCSEAIESAGLKADFEPDTVKMAPFVKELSRVAVDLLEKKRLSATNGVDTNSWSRIDADWTNTPRKKEDSVFLKACKREPIPYTPVWIMRQAGRYQREYLKIRKKYTLLEICHNPEIAAEITLMAVDRLGVDAGIIFSDILLITQCLGFKLEYAKGEGPVIHNPIRCRQDLENLKKGSAKDLNYVCDAIKITRKALRPDIGLIGFAGAPFTVASYIVEGGKSRNYVHTKKMMYDEPKTWDVLMNTLVDITTEYLNNQAMAGADVLQLFDSWVGVLSPDDYREFILPHMKRLCAGLKDSVPLINFGTGNPALLSLMKQTGASVIGLDWRCDLKESLAILGADVAVMGNLDPISLYASPAVLKKRVQAILDKVGDRPGYIFNLGHGILPDMAPENVAELVCLVQELSAVSMSNLAGRDFYHE